MNKFEQATLSAITRHGVSCSYIKTTESYNIETGKATVTSTTTTIKAYKKHIKADQYNYPDLIGKDVAMFYVLVSEIASPEIGDLISFSGVSYRIEKMQEHWAGGVNILHKIVAVRG